VNELDTFLTIAENKVAEGSYKEKGSRFLAFAYYVENEQAVKEHIETLQKTYYDARHFCYAYILGKDKTQSRANDDGEPNGTAGLPILNQIKSKNLTNVLVVVVRYFGGTKLGASGLIVAYKTASQEALHNATIVEKIVKQKISVQFNYLQMNEIMKIIKDFNLEIITQIFDNQCFIELSVRKNIVEMVKEKLTKIQATSIQILSICCLLLSFATQAQEKTSTKFSELKAQKIYDLQDRRNTDSLVTYIANSPQATLGFASLQDSKATNVLLLALQDSNVENRKAAAFALGQMALPETSAMLSAQFEKETVETVKQTLLEAIGKTGLVSTVLESDLSNNSENLILAQLKGLYRAAVWKKTTTVKGTEKAILALNHQNKDIRFWAASYLARNPNKNYTDLQIDTLLVKLQTEKDAFVRMNIVSACSNAFASPINTKIIETLSKCIAKDENELVRIQAIRTLGRFDTLSTQKIVLKYLQDSKRNVAIVASEFVKAHAKKEDKIDYFDRAEQAKQPQVRANLLAVAVLFEKKLQVSKEVQKYYKKTKSTYEKGFLLQALANNIENYGFIRQQIDLQKPNALNTFAFEALHTNRNLPNFDKKNNLQADFTNLIVEILQGKDNVLIGLAATELRNEKRAYKTSIPTIIDILEQAKARLPIPLEIEAMLEVQKSIDFFGGKAKENTTESATTIAFNNPIDWKFVEKLPAKPQVKIKTSKGVLIVELFTDEAPASVANFLKLAQQGFYEDKVFHRIVQNFVVQTGCPRGDGYGNVPFSIRSEFADLHYGEGYLGMASAGKDTEGSQWFITHSPAPHLDGRYTIFGRVLTGMSVVNMLEIGDKIEKIVENK
jgi:uncharacterized YigZ family protein